MEDRLLPINTLLGLLLPNDVTLSVLASAGFQLAGLEVPASGVDGSVTIDAVLFHAETNHLVVLEAKAGANVEARQARAYASLAAPDVVQSAYVTLTRRASPTIEFAYVCLTDHLERIQIGLDQLDLRPPILSVSEAAVRLEQAEGASSQLRGAFPDGHVPLLGSAPRMIAFDQDSDTKIIKPHVLKILVAAMTNRLPQLSLTSLAEQATPQYALYGRRAQNTLRRKVADAARLIAADDPASFEVVPTNNTREGLVRILRTPEDNDPRGRTQAYQAIGKPPGKRRKREKPELPGQLDLLSALESSDNGSTEEPATETQEGEQ